jgi:hypothetical protein
MLWIIIIGIIVFIIYKFLKERENMLKIQVDLHGGMAKKYEYIIEHMTNYPDAKVVKVTRDHIHILARGNSTATNYFITESFNSVEIEWVGQMAILGTHKHKWSFPHNYPQEKIVEEIEEYMDWKVKQIFGNNFK